MAGSGRFRQRYDLSVQDLGRALTLGRALLDVRGQIEHASRRLGGRGLLAVARLPGGDEVIFIYGVLLLAGMVLTARLAVRRSRCVIGATVGTALAGLAILGGFSIGLHVAAVAAVVLIVAGSGATETRS